MRWKSSTGKRQRKWPIELEMKGVNWLETEYENEENAENKF